MCSYLLRVLERAAVLKISRNAGRAKSMAAGGVGEAGSFGPALDHVKDVTAYHCIVGQLVALLKVRNSGPFLSSPMPAAAIQMSRYSFKL
jgi:hypothetical protein